MSKILMIGHSNDPKWTMCLIKHIKISEPGFEIVAFCDDYKQETENIEQYCNQTFWVEKHSPSFVYKVPRIRTWFKQKDIIKSLDFFLDKLTKEGRQFDFVNIQYLTSSLLSRWKKYKDISNKTILTPWGSDVLRANRCERIKMRNFSKHFDYVTDTDSQTFREKIKKILSIQDQKFLSIDFGSDLIDIISSNSSLPRESAKREMGLEDRYVITCGYNGSRAQNHCKIIEALVKVKKELPSNTTLLFPMAYGGDKKYISQVENIARISGFDYKISTEYLTGVQLYYLRKCSDIFIHAQKTDANSSTLPEYFLCDSIVINGAWLKYEMSKFDIPPFYIFESFSDLPSTIIHAIKEGSRVTKQAMEFSLKYGWNFRTSQWIKLYSNK